MIVLDDSNFDEFMAQIHELRIIRSLMRQSDELYNNGQFDMSGIEEELFDRMMKETMQAYLRGNKQPRDYKLDKQTKQDKRKEIKNNYKKNNARQIFILDDDEDGENNE